MSGDAYLAYFYYAFGIVFRGRYDDQILGPRCHFPQFANGLCGHGNARLRLDPHVTRQATKSYVQRANAFGLVVHGLPPIGSVAFL
jgi:hypothetical protein